MKSATRCGIWLALGAMALCGCGSSRDPLARAVAATDKTRALPWVRYTLTIEGSQLFEPSIEVVGGRAAYDLRTGLGYEVLELQRRGRSQLLWLDFRPAGLLLSPSPAPAGLLPAGKTWISVDLSEGAAAPADGDLAAQVEGLAAELSLDEIAWGADSASFVGTHVIGHVPMDEYEVSVDLTKAHSAARRAGRDAVAAAIEDQLRASRSGRLSLRVWVNGPGYVGKIEESVPGSGLGLVTFSFTSFTRPYTGTGPAPSQIVPLASLGTGDRPLWTIVTGS